MPGSQTLTYTTFGSDALSCAFSPTSMSNWQVEEVRFHLPVAAPSSKAFTVQLDHGTDTSLDVVLCKVNVTTAITDIVYRETHVLRGNDTANITWPSTWLKKWGVEIKWMKL